MWGRHCPRGRLGGADLGGRGWPDGRGLSAPGLSVFRGGRRAPLTFSSTQLTMMDGYLRLSQRKNAGTPITAPGWRRRRSPWTNVTLETDGSGGRGHVHFRPRVHRRPEVMSRGAAGEAGKTVRAGEEALDPPGSCRGGFADCPKRGSEAERVVRAAPASFGALAVGGAIPGARGRARHRRGSLCVSPPNPRAPLGGLRAPKASGKRFLAGLGTVSVQNRVKASLFILPGFVRT